MTYEQLHAPHLIDAEVANGLRGLVQSKQLSVAYGRLAIETWQRSGLVRYPMTGLLDRVWELRNNVSAYDAAYVALAETLDCTLLTADARLARVKQLRCSITVVPD